MENRATGTCTLFEQDDIKELLESDDYYLNINLVNVSCYSPYTLCFLDFQLEMTTMGDNYVPPRIVVGQHWHCFYHHHETLSSLLLLLLLS